MKLKHIIALSGSYHGDLEKLFRSLPESKILQLSLIGREVTLRVLSDDLDEVKKSLKKLGVSNLNILEWKKVGTTLDNSGKGCDTKKIIQISIIPSELGEGIKPLAFLSEFSLDKKITGKIKKKIREMLLDAGVTDAFYTVNLMRKASSENEYINAAKTATLQAIFDAGGIVKIEEG
jgi:hypothetical protein